MKLYLSSYRIPLPDKLFELTGKQPAEIKAAIIPNAKDYYADRPRTVKHQEATDYLNDLGIESKIVNLRDHDESELLKKVLRSYDIIWVVGGNTFCLRYEMQRSGFEKIIRELLDEGIVYVGESAGACVAGNSLRGLEPSDNPEFAESILWDGLNLVPNFILPHTDNPMFTQDTETAREIHHGDPTVLELADSQVLIINEDAQEIITKPTE